MATVNEIDVPAAAGRGTRSFFFLAMSVLLVAVVFVGFAPTYFLATAFAAPDVDLIRHVHGSLFSAWLLVLVAQAWLAYTRRMSLHRRLGSFGLALAVPILMAGAWLMLSFASERNGTGIEDAAYIYGTTRLFWGNVILLGSFALFVVLGGYYRRVPDHHKRFMLLATLSMVPPALGRIGNWGLFGLSQMQLVFPSFLLLLLALPLWDLVTRGRPHRVSLFGSAWLFAAVLLAGAVLPRLEWAQAIVRAL